MTGYEAHLPRFHAKPLMRDTYSVRVFILPDSGMDKGYRVQSAFPVRGRPETRIWGGWPGRVVIPDGCRSQSGQPMWTPATRRRHSRAHLRYASDLTDEEWALLEPLLPPPRQGLRSHHRKRRRMDLHRPHPPPHPQTRKALTNQKIIPSQTLVATVLGESDLPVGG